MRLSDFDYDLPDALIARHPPARRGDSRLLDLCGGVPVDRQFADLPELLVPGDLLVMNDTRVLKARLEAHKDSGGRVEVMVERPLGDGVWLALMRASHAPKAGARLTVGDGAWLKVLGREGDLFRIRLEGGAADMFELMARCGDLPLPPYLERAPDADDEARYQTIYAREPGAVAAPTAGLHFSEALLDRLRERGVEFAWVTLHVGAGTFQPVRCEDIREHRMHPERYWIPAATRDAIAAARARGSRVTAVGTTSLRALEAAAADAAALRSHADGAVEPDATPARASVTGPRFGNAATPSEPLCLAAAGDTRLFITPGYRFQVVDRLLTNFHLPRSTLLMLVQAFGGVERLRAAYAHAITQRYRFFSYGDAMLIDLEKETS